MKGGVCISNQEGPHENCAVLTVRTHTLLLLRAEISKCFEQHSSAQKPHLHGVKHRKAHAMSSLQTGWFPRPGPSTGTSLMGDLAICLVSGWRCALWLWHRVACKTARQ